MLKNIFILSVIITLTGCAHQREKSWSAFSGSRSDGIIKLSYPVGLFDNNAPSESEGKRLAIQRCSVWGYRNAVAFGGSTLNCQVRNGYGSCLEGIVIKEYQCSP